MSCTNTRNPRTEVCPPEDTRRAIQHSRSHTPVMSTVYTGAGDVGSSNVPKPHSLCQKKVTGVPSGS